MFKWISLFATSAVVCGAAVAADMAAGKAKVDAVCSECHPNEDWSDQKAAFVEAKIKDIVTGKKKHKKKLKLTDAEIANVAAYWTRKDRG